MYTALLLGFQYQGDHYLPGILVDLYCAYRFCQDAGAQCVVITDLVVDEPSTILSQSVFQGKVDARIFTFLQTLRSTGAYRQVKNEEELLKIMNDAFSEEPERLLLYFTGHGLKDEHGIMLPDGHAFSFRRLSQRVSQLPGTSQIFWLNDCCHVAEISLPYRLDLDGTYELVQGDICPRQSILFIGATTHENQSLTTVHGSVFSTFFFQKLATLSEPYPLLPIIQELQEQLQENPETRQQTPVVYSSDPGILCFWPWLFGRVPCYDQTLQVVCLPY